MVVGTRGVRSALFAFLPVIPVRQKSAHAEGAAELDPNDPCLHGGSAEGRVRSHIVPRFVMKAMSETSATGYLRTTVAPNVRVQDGPWDYLLRRACEARFSAWETPFATNVSPVRPKDIGGLYDTGPGLPC